jgi:hypothetical protein
MSAQDQSAGQAAKLTVSKVTALSVPALCEVTAIPACSVPVRLAIVTVAPATALQLTPSLDVYAVKVAPARPMRT